VGVGETLSLYLGMSTMLSQKNGAKSRKAKRCRLCGESIAIGDLKDVRTGVGSDGFWAMHMHPECHAREQEPGAVDRDWYDDTSEPAFLRPFLGDSSHLTPSPLSLPS